MSYFIRAGLTLASLSLSGCFHSDDPLIDFPRADTPIAEGRYTYADNNGKAVAVTVAIDGRWTNVTTLKDDGSTEVQGLVIYDLHHDFYVAMAPRYEYFILYVKDRNVTVFDPSRYCRDYLDIVRAKGINLYGGVRVTGDNPRTCHFDNLNDMLDGAIALIENNRLGAWRTYRRQ